MGTPIRVVNTGKFSVYENCIREYCEYYIDTQSLGIFSLEDLKNIHAELGAYLNSLSLERYKTNYCLQPDYKHMTIYQYASDALGSRYKANNWLLRQSNLTLEEVENKLGQIEYGVFG